MGEVQKERAAWPETESEVGSGRELRWGRGGEGAFGPEVSREPARCPEVGAS